MISNAENNIPQEYLCPITLEIMTDPVIAADGQTYQRESITEWLSRGNRTSPLDGSNLSHTQLKDNLFARKIIREYQNRLPEKMGDKSNLEKCIQEKEEIIKILIEKINQINSNQNSSPTNSILELKQENAALKKQLEEMNIQFSGLLNKKHTDKVVDIDFTEVNDKDKKFYNLYIKNLPETSMTTN
jgi:hypothetical protein